MKVLLGVPEYPPYQVGGGGVVYQNLAAEYRAAGYQVTVVYGYYPAASWWEPITPTTDQKIRLYQIPEIPAPRGMPFMKTAMPPNVRSLHGLRKIVSVEQPDVAHLHGYGLIMVNFLARALHAAGVPYIFTIHGYPESQKQRPLWKVPWWLYRKFLLTPTLEAAAKITCVSKSIKQDPRNCWPGKSVVIPNGIDPASLREINPDLDIRQSHQLDQETVIILSLGRISRMKGYQKVISLLPEFINAGQETVYLIAGRDDGYRKTLARLADELGVGEQVRFVDYLNEVDRNSYLHQSDIVAIPSLWEPFGMVALEAGCLAKPILTSNVGGLQETLENYPGRVDLGRAPETVVQETIRIIGRDIRTNLEDRFAWDKIARRYLGILTEVS